MQALNTMQKSVVLDRAGAIKAEVKSFANLAVNDVTAALVGLFLKDQYVKKVSKQYMKDSTPVFAGQQFLELELWVVVWLISLHQRAPLY